MLKHLPLIYIFLSFTLISSSAADEIILKNGSRIVGEVEKKESDALEVKTPFAGTLKIKWVNVIEVKTDKPVKIMLHDKSTKMVDSFKNEDNIIKVSNHGEASVNMNQSEMAFINPELWRLGIGYKMTAAVNISIKNQNGNTNKNEFDVDGKLALRRRNDRFSLTSEYENDKSNEIQSSFNWLLLGKYDYFLNEKTYLGGSIFLEHDEFADLELRSTYGLHLGHQYFESKAINLSIEAGLAQVYEGFYEANDSDFTAATWGIEYDQFLLDEFVQFYHRDLGRVDLSDPNKYIIKSWTGLRFPLTLGVSVSAEVEADYDNAPATDVDKTDTTFRLKIGYNY